MRPLKNMSIVDKAKVLHKLFPEDIIAFIVFEKFVAMAFQRDKESYRQNWHSKENRFNFDYWLTLVDDAKTRIERHEKEMAKESHFFAEQLFDGFTAHFSIYCLERFTASDKCHNQKIIQAIELLFV
jgi:hypothetical protein